MAFDFLKIIYFLCSGIYIPTSSNLMALEDGVLVPYEQKSQLQSHQLYDRYFNTDCDMVAFTVEMLVIVLQNKAGIV